MIKKFPVNLNFIEISNDYNRFCSKLQYGLFHGGDISSSLLETAPFISRIL